MSCDGTESILSEQQRALLEALSTPEGQRQLQQAMAGTAVIGGQPNPELQRFAQEAHAIFYHKAVERTRQRYIMALQGACMLAVQRYSKAHPEWGMPKWERRQYDKKLAAAGV